MNKKLHENVKFRDPVRRPDGSTRIIVRLSLQHDLFILLHPESGHSEVGKLVIASFQGYVVCSLIVKDVEVNEFPNKYDPSNVEPSEPKMEKIVHPHLWQHLL